MAPALKVLTNDATLSTITDDAHRRFPGEYEKVKRHIIRSAATFGLTGELITLGALQLIRNYRTAGRCTMTEAPEPVAPANDVSPEALHARVEQRLFWERYTLFGGQPLHVATADSLSESVELRRKQAAGNVKRADFEGRVASRLRRRTNDADAMVKDVLDNTLIVKLAKEFELAES